MKRKLVFGVSLFAVALVAAVFALHRRAGASVSGEVIRGNLVESAYGIGTIAAEHVYNLKLGVMSQVARREVRLGDLVHKGDKLIELDGFPAARAPFDGLVTAMNYEVGEIVFAQTVVLTVVDMSSLYLEVSMDERTLGAVARGQIAKVSFEGQRAVLSEGRVRSIYSNAGQFMVMIDFDTRGLNLLPGMTADVAITVSLHEDKLLAPLGAVKTSNRLTVLTPAPKEIAVKLGATDGKYTVIESGDVHEGDHLQLVAVQHTQGPQP